MVCLSSFVYSLFSRPYSLLLCHSGCIMKIVLGIVAVVLVVAALFADYRWKQWMAARKRDRF